jgi:hypothetical protein
MILLAIALFAQTLSVPVQAYTVADPVRPDAIGLATPDGYFAVSKSDNCDPAIGPDMNVELRMLVGFSTAGVLNPIDQPDHTCAVRFEQKMSDQPCFTNDAGDCDVAAS